jgi:radical SAM superfamily enzyme YgiQ (UPF0313 family)
VSSFLRKNFPGVPLIAVGVHGSIEPEATNHVLEVDYILPGELEASIPWFVDWYEQSMDTQKPPLPESEIPIQTDPAALPVPDYDMLGDLSIYHSEVIDPCSGLLHSGTTGLIFANRGCPYACSYCFVWFGKKLRIRPVNLVIEELAEQVKRGVSNFFFLDYTFTLDHNWVRSLCTAIQQKRLAITWVCQTRCERVTPGLLIEMKNAGCTGIYYGVEAPWIAEIQMAKPTSRGVIEEAINATNSAGIRCFLFILLGLEAQAPALGRQLVDWLAQIPATFTVNPLIPRPHTALWKRYNGPQSVEMWQTLEDSSLAMMRKHHWYPEMEALLSELQNLPNYIMNASTNGFVIR